MPALAELTGDEGGDYNRTFVFENEGHTLGNALKAIICRYPEVDFCAYTIPHPGENIMHFRIQSNKNHRAVDLLKQGLQDLENVCDHTLKMFEEEMKEFSN